MTRPFQTRRSGVLASFDLPSKECSALKQAHLVRHSYTKMCRFCKWSISFQREKQPAESLVVSQRLLFSKLFSLRPSAWRKTLVKSMCYEVLGLVIQNC